LIAQLVGGTGDVYEIEMDLRVHVKNLKEVEGEGM